MAKIISYFPDTNLRSAHDGLRKIAKSAGKNIDNIEPGNFMLFVNKSQNILKAFGANNAILHVKTKTGARFDFDAIKMLPSLFGASGGFDYGAALRESLIKKLEIRR